MQRRVQRHRLIPVLTAGLLGMLVAGGALALTWPRAPAEGSADVTFARDMSAHHAQAVEMSVTMVKRAADPAVKLLAQDILLTQQAQIGQMSGWLMAWGRPLAGTGAPMAGMDRVSMGLATPQQVRELASLPVKVAETQYLKVMRRHHQGGVRMAQSALKHVNRPEVRVFAGRVVTAQTSEMGAIDALLVKRGAGAGAAAVPTPAAPHTEGMTHE